MAIEKSLNKIEINTLEDVEKLIQEKFPDGLESKRKQDFFQNGVYIGFNLCRYGYTDLLAAECHAMRDTLLGYGGHSYGFPFKPKVEHHKDDDGTKWYEVVTG
jgi:hypothetical protein